MPATGRHRAVLAAVGACLAWASFPACAIAPRSPTANGEPPELEFQWVSEVPLPGPLPPRGPRVQGQVIEIPVAGALARTSWDTGASPELLPLKADDLRPPPQSPWVFDRTGRHRFRALPSGWIEAQTRCRNCERGWRKDWRLRVAGSTYAAPLVTRHRIYFGAMDNRVYGIKRRNGHRLWVTEVGSRVTRPLVLLEHPPLAEGPDSERPRKRRRPLALLLLIPDAGTELIALDAVGGAKVATFTLPRAEERLVGEPVVTPDGKIIVARQEYAPGQASLVVLELARSADPAPVPYNATDSSAPAARPPDGRQQTNLTSAGRVAPDSR